MRRSCIYEPERIYYKKRNSHYTNELIKNKIRLPNIKNAM